MSRGVLESGRRPRVDGVAIVGELTSVVTEVEADGGSAEDGGGVSNESGAKVAFNTSGAEKRES